MRLLARGKNDLGVRVRETDGGLALELHVVVDHGINLAEVTAMSSPASRTRSNAHRARRQAVDVHVDRARRAA